MEWKPDLLHRLLQCGDNSGPPVRALAGYYLHKIVFSLMIVHSGVVFAGVFTYEALDVAGCLPSSDDDTDTCQKESTDDDTVNCKALWGLIKPDSLLTVIATGAAIVLAVSSIFMGTIIDITPYRRQIGIFGTSVCIFSIALCMAIITPSELTLGICSLGLFILFIFKDLHFLIIESYVPELSHISSELSHAISTAGTWLFGGEIVTTIIWVIVGFFVTDGVYGFVVTVGTVILMSILTPISYSRLPDVPSTLTLPPGTSIISHTLSYQYKLFVEIYEEYPDLGIVIAANMVYDPALNALFIAAIQVLVSKYHFTASQIPIILGVAIICAMIGAFLCKYSYRLDTCCCIIVNDSPESHQTVSPIKPQPDGDKEIEPEDEQTTNRDSYVELGGITPISSPSPPSDPFPSPLIAQSSLTLPNSSSRYLQALRLKRNIMYGLVCVIVITLCGTFFMIPCDIGLACLFGALWGISLAYCWTCSNMLRATLVPGGKEGQFAGLLVSTGNFLSWLPLLIFSIANEVWTIEGAMVTLTGFYLLGILILLCCQTERGVTVALNSLSKRRWVHQAHHGHDGAGASAEVGSG